MVDPFRHLLRIPHVLYVLHEFRRVRSQKARKLRALHEHVHYRRIVPAPGSLFRIRDLEDQEAEDCAGYCICGHNCRRRSILSRICRSGFAGICHG